MKKSQKFISISAALLLGLAFAGPASAAPGEWINGPFDGSLHRTYTISEPPEGHGETVGWSFLLPALPPEIDISLGSLVMCEPHPSNSQDVPLTCSSTDPQRANWSDLVRWRGKLIEPGVGSFVFGDLTSDPEPYPAFVSGSPVLTLNEVTGGIFGDGDGVVYSTADEFGNTITWIIISDQPTARPVPEPATLILLGSGLAGVAGLGAWRRAKKA